jgi:hypothetical protein
MKVLLNNTNTNMRHGLTVDRYRSKNDVRAIMLHGRLGDYGMPDLGWRTNINTHVRYMKRSRVRVEEMMCAFMYDNETDLQQYKQIGPAAI